MTVTIFAKNYRGFKEIELPLDGNIFLVGDNSSGKTSIIHLISYILQSELIGKHELDSRYTVGKYDFFSPYFNNADVTVGYISKDKDEVVSRVVTFRYVGEGEPPEVIKITSISGNRRVTFNILKSVLQVKVSNSEENLSVTDIYNLHEQSVGYVNFSGKEKTRRYDQINDVVSALMSDMSAIIEDSKKFKLLQDIMSAIVTDSLPGTHHCGPVRALPEKFYAFERTLKATGLHFAPMWHDLKKDPDSGVLSLIAKFGKESKLFERLNVEKISKKFQDSPLVVTVERGGRQFLLNQVGVGVSQVIPIIIESIFTKYVIENAESKSDFMLLQQPELHLHPVAQAAMGEFVYDMASYGVNYIIETHSDYLIDRFRAKIREDENEGVLKSKILYFENSAEGNKFSTINIASNGELEKVPENYKDFFVNELMRTMF